MANNVCEFNITDTNVVELTVTAELIRAYL